MSKVVLNFSCTNLVNKDVLSKSDPQLELSISIGDGQITPVGKTETLKDTLNPEFAKNFTVDYWFEKVQTLHIQLYDVDGKSKEKLGNCKVSLAKVASNGFVEIALDNGGKGKVKIVGEELVESRDHLKIQLSAKGLPKMDFFGSADGYFIVKRSYEGSSGGNDFSAIHKSEIKKNTLKPVWSAFEMSLSELCNGDWQRPLQIEVYDWDARSDDDLIGVANVTAQNLRDAFASKNGIPLINAKKAKKKKKYTNSGMLYVDAFEVSTNYTFLDYLRSGYCLGLTTAIDFTGSNGDPKYQQSLHYINPYQPNQYQHAISAVGQILLEYDSDGMIGAFGYGAKLPDGLVSHCFPLTFNQSHFVQGVPGLLAAYQGAILQVTLSGPTNFAPFIHKTIEISKAAPHEYVCALIITDGVISDMTKTKKAMIEASRLPISYIIIGVGNADFSSMEELDSDDGLMRHGNAVAARDNCQFVSMQAFGTDFASLTAEVLRELPGQFVQSMRVLKLKPIGMA